MDLILWRHAEAHPETGELPDLQRPLTPKGERQAARMSEWLKFRLAQTTRILVSPAVRSQQTAKALGLKFRTVPEIGPEASVEALLKAARWPDASEPVLIVGHQPTLGLVAARLLAGVEQEWPIKKGAVWWLRARERIGESQIVLQAVQSPDCL